jgi:DNA-binding MarR family transcriptional regulator
VEDEEFLNVAQEIQVLNAILYKIGRRGLVQRLEQVGVDISAGQYPVLRALAHQEYTLAELSRRLFLDPSTLVPMVDALERKGFVRRVQDPNDRRRTPLTLTKKGAELLAQVPLQAEDSLFVQSLRNLGEERCQQLLDLLADTVWPLLADKEVVDSCQSLQKRARTESVAGTG